jgi:hypothetical protein
VRRFGLQGLQASGQLKNPAKSTDKKVNARPVADFAGQESGPFRIVKNRFLTKAAHL